MARLPTLLALLGAIVLSLPVAARDGAINHVVLVWLDEPGNGEHRARVIAGSHQLRDIPGVLEVRVGRVLPSSRTIVDDTFDVGVVMTFTDTAAMAAYLEHPEHQRILREVFLPVVNRILVYDFRSE